jgi:phenylalanyl-tRNA synthetase alpha chain
MSMDDSAQQLIDQAREAVGVASDANALAIVKARFLGKDGLLTARMKALGGMSPQDRAQAGKALNTIKQSIESLLTDRQRALEEAELHARLAEESIDVTLPGRGVGQGGLHPVTLTIERIETIFRSIGFEVADGPEIEEDFFNFTALNTPHNHPARSMHDTFYVEGEDDAGRPLLLRTHTSPMQIRYARMHAPPIKVIAPGKTYRVDSDATHSPMFHQIEGLWLGANVSFKDLKVVFASLVREFFETDDFDVRFRPSFFPFTEPSAEIDIRFGSGPLAGRWLEVAGSGQVHPNVVRNFGLDPEAHIGFAFGIGADRFAMLRYGIDDLRLMFDGDLRFLTQFR